MYLAAIILLMAVLPLISMLVEELVVQSGAGVVTIAGRWFVFWGVGARLFLAGLRQMAMPELTARDIFRTREPAALKVVAELGFANIATGIVALGVVFFNDWLVPAAIAGGVFYLLAGIGHARNSERSPAGTIAMVSDLAAALLLAVWLAAQA